MPKFSPGGKPERIRTVKWNDSTNQAFKGHIVRMSLGTSAAASYPIAAADLNLGVMQEDGTSLQQLTVALDGVVQVRNSLNGTVNIGDPIIYDDTNSNGTTGFARSAYATESLAAIGNSSDVGTQLPTRVPLASRAIPGSFRETGTNLMGAMHVSGTVVFTHGTRGVAPGNVFYTIDQPVIGYALERATAPRQLFKVEIAKQRYIKNNVNN